MTEESKVPAEYTPAPPVPEAEPVVSEPVTPKADNSAAPVVKALTPAPVEPPAWITHSPVYNTMVWCATVVLPALGVLVGSIGGACGWSGTTLTLTIIAGVTTFCGAVLGVKQVTTNN